MFKFKKNQLNLIKFNLIKRNLIFKKKKPLLKGLLRRVGERSEISNQVREDLSNLMAENKDGLKPF